MRNFLLLAIVLLIGGSIPASCNKQSSVSTNNLQPPDFPFTLADDRGSLAFIAPEHYNQKNLQELFLWQYKKWLRKQAPPDLHVFTDQRLLDVYLEDRRKGFREYPEQALIKSPTATPWYYPRREFFDAQLSLAPSEPMLFGTEDAIDSRGFNVAYIFAPDLTRPSIKKEVVLRGSTWREGKYNAHTQEFPWQEGKISWTTYDIYNVEPSGRYHTFNITRQINGRERTRIIFHILPGEEESNNTGRVKLLNDKVAYVCLGWRYSVTLDGGQTWHLWDVERDLLSWNCCDAGLIKDVQISTRGEGVMTLRPIPNGKNDSLLLRTQDFGEHWE